MLIRTAFTATLLTLASLANAGIEAKTYPVKDFSELVVAGAAEVEITQDGSEYLRIEAEPEMLERVRVDLDGNRLAININGNGGVLGWLKGKRTVRMVVRVKQLNEMGLSGAAHADINELNGKALGLTASGASEINIGALNIEQLQLNLSGASEARIGTLSGIQHRFDLSGASELRIASDSHVEQVRIQASGASDASARKLAAQQAELQATGASDINLSVTGKLTAHASGASNIDYYGSPVAQVDSNGASNITAHKPD